MTDQDLATAKLYNTYSELFRLVTEKWGNPTSDLAICLLSVAVAAAFACGLTLEGVHDGVDTAWKSELNSRKKKLQ